MAFNRLLIFASIFACIQYFHAVPFGHSCDPGVMTIEEFLLNPTPVLSPGYVYYSLKATVKDADTAKTLSKGDLQMSIELLSPQHGVVPMPCEDGVGSCTKSLREYAPYLAHVLSEGETSVLIDNKEICLFDAAAMGDIFATGQYRFTAKFLEADSHRTLSCFRFETYVEHSDYPCQGSGDKTKQTRE